MSRLLYNKTLGIFAFDKGRGYYSTVVGVPYPTECLLDSDQQAGFNYPQLFTSAVERMFNDENDTIEVLNLKDVCEIFSHELDKNKGV